MSVGGEGHPLARATPRTSAPDLMLKSGHRAPKSPSGLLQGHQKLALEHLIGACFEHRRMGLPIPVVGRFARVIIGRERPASLILGAPDRRDSMVADFAGLEDHASVEVG